MANIVRIPITNVYMHGDYTGRIMVGAKKTPLNVILDTGSSALAVDGHKYAPDLGGGDAPTQLAQTDSYGDGSSWSGAVLKTTVAAGTGSSVAALAGTNVAVAYEASSDMFGAADGILGLAYAPLDDAYQMPEPTWPKRYTAAQITSQGAAATIQPYLTQLAGAGVVSDRVAFYTLRSFVHEGGGANDPWNQGWMILGGGEESTDLYTGTFQIAKVLSDDWYNTNLKAIKVGGSAVHVPARPQQGMPSNSIVDSGTNSLNLGPKLLNAVISKFNASQQALLKASILEGNLVSVSDLGDLSTWPSLTFVLQGLAADVSLTVTAKNYWQVDAQKVGAAMTALSQGSDGLAILGLPLMNGYFTIFDGEADGGRGTINFAPIKTP
ncbi:MAG TPA: pepsin-like aspartic protease [Polyangiaceae bacterium]|jgi:hypothetical protein